MLGLLFRLFMKKKLESLLHFYAIKVTNFCFQTKRSYILNEGKHFKKKNLFNQKCIFLSKKMWSRKFSASSLLFSIHSHGIKLLVSNRRKRPKIPKSYISTSYHMSVNFSFSFLSLQTACMFLLRLSRLRNSQEFIINLYSRTK